MAFSQYYINETIGKLQLLQARYADEMCDILKRHTGRITLYDDLVNTNNIVGWIIDILYGYVPYGDTTLNDEYNGLSEVEMQQIINYAYRMLNKYGAKIHIPDNPNVYM